MNPRSFICLTNIPTPYRLFQFRLMHRELARRGWSFEVWFMASCEQGRSWKFSAADCDFPHRVLPGLHRHFGRVPMHINFGVLSELRRARPDVLLIAGSWTLPTVWLAVASRVACRKIFWAESHLDSSRNSGFFTNFFRHMVFRRFTAFAVPGRLAADYVKHHNRSAQIYSLPNIVDPELFQKGTRELRKNKRFSPAGKRTLLIVARLAPEKGLLEFVQGVESLSIPERERLEVAIAGSGALRRRLQKRIDAANLPIQLLGEQGAAKLVALYARADAFCLPSIFDPNPLSVIEALWAGLPLLLSSRVGNNPECLREGENGFRFDPFSPESIALALSSWLSLGSQELERLSAVSAQIAQREFSPEKVVGSFLDHVLAEGRESAAHADFLHNDTIDQFLKIT